MREREEELRRRRKRKREARKARHKAHLAALGKSPTVTSQPPKPKAKPEAEEPQA
jgi:hypothetical protein